MRLGRALAALAFAFGLAGSATAAPALWAVKDADSTIYLFGSMHILEPGLSWRTPAFNAAYARATTLRFETDIGALTDKAAMAALVQRYGLDPDHPLSGKITAADQAALKARVEAAGISAQKMERFRPWMAALMLTELPFRKAGFDPNAGADVVIHRAAGQDRKTIKAFETAESQAQFLADLPEAVQVQLLQDSLSEDARTFGDIKSVETAWLAGDLVRLGPLLTQQMKRERPQLYEALIRERNRAWAATIAADMAGWGVEMINVGALHMVGKDGLPALLAARGFKVRRIQ